VTGEKITAFKIVLLVKVGETKVKRNLSIASILLVGVLSSLSPARAQGPYGLPLATLAGNWAGPSTATFALCFNSDFTSVVDCTEAANAPFFNQVSVIQQTNDAKGNFCATVTSTNSPEFPFPPGPAGTVTAIQVGKVTSYNPATESGTAQDTAYNAGPGTYCNGSVLVNTSGAAVTAVFTNAFTLSENGNRSDAIVLTWASEPISDVANLVASAYVHRQ
jgi:hypothetical protein